MSELQELYQSLILDHNKSPRNFGTLEGADRHAEGYNPLCGDQVALDLKLDGDRIADIKFSGNGCAISKASASLMTTAVKGKTLAEAEALFTGFHGLVTGTAVPEDPKKSLGKLAIFAGVAEFPVRVKCATLAWHALHDAMK
ncbi:MAG TPA: SUF system NifU family Fe-S cluster assembly protein [Gemmatimonadales bacterium]|jgi:nitrogen fixation NifU-like protein|nr:SUF system NifU family Fe-S cluster assembly protein [Gemmatimonadales bacterium]